MQYAVLASLAAVFVAVVCVLAVVGTSDYTSSAGDFEELAAKGKKAAAKVKPVKYGDTVTLMNVYNNYMVVSLNGRTFTAGYLGKNDQVPRALNCCSQSRAFTSIDECVGVACARRAS